MKFSVLLPTRNGGKYLRNCITSILLEPYQDMELVVSDNANTDETQEILKSFSSDSRLKVVRFSEPVCVTENWNNALLASKGDYVLMMGDDDGLLPGYFNRMEEILKRYNNPDCVTYNAYSYMAPYSIGQDRQSYYKDPFYSFGKEFEKEKIIQKEERFLIVRDMFRFHNRLPLNMQTTLMSRVAMNQIRGGAFQPPFPDHYAINSLLLTAMSWVFVPEKLLVVGVSSKSFGHFAYNNKQEEGKKYLGINPDFKGQLPGADMNNCMHIWLSLLKINHADLLKKIKISRCQYIRHQVYSWFAQYKSGILPLNDLGKRFLMLNMFDWCYLLFTVFDKKSWKHFLNRSSKGGKATQIQKIWPGAMFLEGVSNINEFSSWINKQNNEQNMRGMK
ncbi:MAG: glycosyltransferase family 2 protein [Candidatus Omnitrophica bacterium]|nr:glycosyltransferase family 2 protein [Candidatus Omnitrophota bacterium]